MSSSQGKSFVVTTSINGSSRSQVWHAHAPLPIGFPFRWVAEQTEGGVRVRDVATQKDEVHKDAVQTLTHAAIEKGATLHLGPKITLQIRPTRSLPAAFESNAGKEGIIQIYACVGTWMIQSAPVGEKFIAHAQGKPAFTVYQASAGAEYRIDFHVEGVKVSQAEGETGKAARTGQVGQALQFSSDKLSSTVLRFGAMIWRFGAVRVPELPRATDIHEDPDNQWFKQAVRLSLVGLGALMLATWFWPQPAEEELVPEQFTQLVMKAQPKAASNKETAAARSTGAAPRKAEDTAVAQAFRAKALSNAVSGLLKGGMTTLLAQSDFVTGSKKSKEMFNSTSSALKATGPSAEGMTAPGVKVAAVGGDGDGKGVGYKTGEKANVAGQGKSFVSMDIGGSDVTEGLTKDEVGEVIHRHMSEIRYCYESAMLRTPDLEGKLVVAFTIGAPGTVKTANVKQSTLPDPRLDDCVLRRLVTWKFPQTRGGVDVSVSYPFIFKTLGR